MTRTVDDILKDAVPRTKTIYICMRGDLIDEIDQAEAELVERRERNGDAERLTGDPEARELARRIEDLRAQAKAAEESFKVQAIGDYAWTALLRKHHMPDAKRAELIASGARAEDLPPYDPDEFSEVALAASAVEPEMTLEGAQKLHRFLNYQQWGRLFAAVRSVNIADRDIPFSVTAYALTLASPSKPEQPEHTESPGPS